MLVIAHRVAPSPYGLGLFTLEDLKAGQLVCNSDDRLVRVLPLAELATYPAAMQAHIRRYAYRGVGPDTLTEALYYNMDDTRFINHADAPNLVYDREAETYRAVRDVPAGTELTCDYGDFAQRGDDCFNF